MGFVPFCVASLFFFMTPSLMLLSVSNKWRFLGANSLVNLVLFSYALWLFPQISRESLAFSTLLFDVYCYLVLSVGIVAGSVIKAIELKVWMFIPLTFTCLVAINLFIMYYCGWF